MQITRQSMRNLQLNMMCRAILMYSKVEKRNLNRFDVSYDRACLDTQIDEYYIKMLETLIDHNDHHIAPLSSENLQQAVSRVMEETKEVERDAKRNANNMTTYTFLRSPATVNTQRKDENVTNERQITLNILKETIK